MFAINPNAACWAKLVAATQLFLFATCTWSQPFVPCTFQGVSWERDDIFESAADRVTESLCAEDASVEIDASNDWTFGFETLACHGRVTDQFGHSEFSPDSDSGQIPGSLPLRNAGGLLFELFVRPPENPGVDTKVGALLLAPNRSLAMRSFAADYSDLPDREINNALGIFARSGATPTVADIHGDYQIAGRSVELETVDEWLVSQFLATVSFHGTGDCTISNAAVTGMTGDVYVNEGRFRTLSGSGDAGNLQTEFDVFEGDPISCSYQIVGDGKLALTTTEPGDQSTTYFYVSDDRRYLVPASDPVPDEESTDLGFLLRSGDAQGVTRMSTRISQSNATLDGTFLFDMSYAWFEAGGSGLPGAGKSPLPETR